MDTDNPKSLIEAAFRNPKQTLHRKSILIPTQPLDLDEVTKSAVENEDDEDQFAEFGPETLFEDIGWECTSFFAFYWQSLGPMVWECYLSPLSV